MIPKRKLLDIPVTCLPFEEQIMLMLRWAKIRASKVICLANVHMLIEAYRNPTFAKVLHDADLVTPDGKPLVIMLRKLGIKNQNQVAGFDVFLNLCDLAEQTGTKVYFLGSTEDILKKMKQKLNREYPILQIAGMKAPPNISIPEIINNKDLNLIEEINQSGAGIVFVCLGCPKQEIWMSQHQGTIQAVMIGVGAVFSMYAGINPRAPQWIQQAGLEWLYRLLQEPRRLWRRYSSTIPSFLYLAIKQLVAPYKKKLGRARRRKTKRNIAVNLQALDFPYEKLGKILVRQNAISDEDLHWALSQQKLNNNQKLGEILVRENLISLSQLKFYLKNQNIKLGEFLVEREALSKRDSSKFFNIQKKSNEKISEIIVKQSIFSEERFKELLIEYYTVRKGLYLTEEKNNNDNNLSWWIEQSLAS